MKWFWWLWCGGGFVRDMSQLLSRLSLVQKNFIFIYLFEVLSE
jgi:hypothetical protein